MLIFLDENPYHISNLTTSFPKDAQESLFRDLIFTTAPRNGDRYPIGVLVIGMPEGVNSVIEES